MLKRRKHRFKLKNGVRVVVRPIQRTDRDFLIDIFDHLSSDSRYMRFNEPLDHATRAFIEENAARIAQEAVEQGRGWLALAVAPDGAETAIGGVRYIRSGTDSAEIAITIRDDYQGLGLGRHLVQLLVGTARQDGVRTLSASIHKANAPALRLLRHIDRPVTQVSDGDSITLTVDISD